MFTGLNTFTLFINCWFLGIPLMPISDLIIICFSSPIFAVFLESLFLNKKIHLVSVLLCCSIFLGELMVVKPSFIFSTISVPVTSEVHIFNKTEIEATALHQENKKYVTGSLLALYTAIGGVLGIKK